MSNEEFIEQIAALVIKYANQYGIKVHSPIIAQAILESSYGRSPKAKFHNYFGLKYRKNRVSCNKGYFEAGGSEQSKEGVYSDLPSNTKWYAFENMDQGVKGYFEFITNGGYKNLIGVTDPKEYLIKIKEDEYATSKEYVNNVYSTLIGNNLLKYDKKEEQKVSNSSKVDYIKISPNKTTGRDHSIDTITIHCVVGQLTVEEIGGIFFKEERKASSNYGIGFDGRIGMYVEEKDRSWCSSNAANDNRAITIEVASATKTPYAVMPVALSSLIELIADVCERNGIRELKWQGNKALIGQVDKQNMTVHRWFKNKACPGDYLYSRHGYIANKVNEILNGNKKPVEVVDVKDDGIYRVQTGAFRGEQNANTYLTKVRAAGFNAIKVTDNGFFKIQVGSFREKDNADDMAKKLVAAGFLATIIPVNPTIAQLKDLTIIAKEVINGKWGNEEDRKKRLEAAGYKYTDVQRKVSELLG